MPEKIVKPIIRKIMVSTKPVKVLAENPNRKAYTIYNNGSVTVEILSGPEQSYGDGIPVPAGTSHTNRDSQGEVWLVAASGTQDIRYEEDA